jgi:hypothetical protein
MSKISDEFFQTAIKEAIIAHIEVQDNSFISTFFSSKYLSTQM